MCVCVCHVCVHRRVQVYFVKTVREIRTNVTASGTSPVCVCVGGGGVQAIYITMQGVLLHMYVLCE